LFRNEESFKNGMEFNKDGTINKITQVPFTIYDALMPYPSSSFLTFFVPAIVDVLFFTKK